jgi:hypothetical protein
MDPKNIKRLCVVLRGWLQVWQCGGGDLQVRPVVPRDHAQHLRARRRPLVVLLHPLVSVPVQSPLAIRREHVLDGPAVAEVLADGTQAPPPVLAIDGRAVPEGDCGGLSVVGALLVGTFHLVAQPVFARVFVVQK